MSKKVGYLGEDFALKYLKEKGFQFVEKNYNAIYGEIDLIMKKKDFYHFVEVKTRLNDELDNYDFSDILTRKKKARFRRAILIYLEKNDLMNINYQADLIIVLLNKYKKLKKIYYYPNLDLWENEYENQ